VGMILWAAGIPESQNCFPHASGDDPARYCIPHSWY